MSQHTTSQSRMETSVNGNPVPPSVAQFSLNHPKNYFGVPLAVSANEDTDAVISEYLVQMPERARAGAYALGLIDHTGSLTGPGETVVETVTSETTLSEELETLAELKGSSQRFIESAPRYWNPLTRHVMQENPLVGDVVTLLESTGPVTLPELTRVAVRSNHTVQEIVLRNPDTVTPDTVQNTASDPLLDADLYSGQAVYQFKNLLFHCGILTERGADTTALVPTQDIWALDPSLVDLGGEL